MDFPSFNAGFGMFGMPSGLPDGMMLQAASQGFAPMAGGRSFRPQSPLSGVPLIGGNGMVGQMAQSMLAGPIAQAMAPYGMMPTGFHDQNVYDFMRNQRFMQSQNLQMQQAAALDRMNTIRAARGMAAVTGTPWGSQQMAAAGSLADAVQVASPFLAQMAPGMLDEMMGLRGSATVMANNMLLGGRYRLDPVTGRMGMNQESAFRMAERTYRNLYEDGRLSDMQGVSAGQLGNLFDDLQRRGMVAGMSGAESRRFTARHLDDLRYSDPAELNRIAARSNVTLRPGGSVSPGDLDKLSLDPSVSERLRSFDADKVQRSLKSYIGAVSAMRDVFGDIGQPNAPMSQLIQGLEALTGGSAAQLQPGRLTSIVRTTQALAGQTGMSMDAAMGLQAHAQSRAANLGLEPIFGVTAAQGAMAFGGAYRGAGLAGYAGWNRFNADQMTQLDANLRVNASGSQTANRLAVVMRLRDRLGGFQTGSAADRLASAISGGLDQFSETADGPLRSVSLGDSEFMRILQGARGRGGASAGITEGYVREMMGQTSTNREFVDTHNIGGLVRRMQGSTDIQRFIASRTMESLTAQLQASGIGGEEATRVAGATADRIAERIRTDLSPTERSNTGAQHGAIARIIADSVSRHLPTDRLTGGTAAFSQRAADLLQGNINRQMPLSGLNFRTLGNMLEAFNPETMADAQRQEFQAGFTASMREAMAPLGRGSVLQRTMQALQNAGPNARVGEIISSMFGGVALRDIDSRISGPLQTLHTKRQELETLAIEVGRTSDPARRAQLTADLQNRQRAFAAEAGELARTGTNLGLIGSDQLTVGDTNNAVAALRQRDRYRADVAGIAGMFGHEVDPAAAAALVGQRFGNVGEAAAVLRLRAQAQARNVTDAEVAAHQQRIGATSASFARESLINTRLSRINVSDAEARHAFESGGTYAEGEGAAGVLERRRAIAIQPREEEVSALMESGLPRAEAVELATVSRRAQRLGIPEDELRAALAGGGGAEAAFSRVVARRSEAMLEGTADVVRGRMRDRGRRLTEFGRSTDGRMYGEALDRASAEVETVATTAVMSAPSMNRLGPAAVARYQSVMAVQQRRRELAMRYAGGDLRRLSLGHLDLDRIDVGTDAGRRRFREVIAETEGLNATEASDMAFFQAGVGREGHAWGEDDAGTARMLFGAEGAARTADVRAARLMTGDEERLARTYAGSMTRLEELARGMGVDVATARAHLEGRTSARLRPLSEAERTRVEEARAGYIDLLPEQRRQREAMIGDIARARGVSGADLIRNTGYANEGQLSDFRAANDEAGAARAALAPIARRLGLADADALRGAVGVLDAVGQMGERAGREAAATPMQALEELYGGYNLSFDAGSAQANTQAGLLSTGVGARMARALARSSQMLQNYAGRGGRAGGLAGVDTMAAAFAADAAGAQRDYGFSDAEAKEIQDALDLQKRSGFDRVGRGVGADLLGPLLESLSSGGRVTDRGGGTGGTGQGGPVEISGNLTINPADPTMAQINASTVSGGGRLHAV